ncbi:MAG: hypothetical protein ACRCYD_00760 [Plesiomonas sp.]
MTVTIQNNANCGIIIPGMGELAEVGGLVAPGNTIDVPDTVADSEYVQYLVSIGELVEVARIVDTDTPEEVPPVETSMDDLRAEAKALGIDVSNRWSRETLVNRIAEANNAEQ